MVWKSSVEKERTIQPDEKMGKNKGKEYNGELKNGKKGKEGKENKVKQ